MADAMISLQCASSESMAKELNQYLRSKGYTTWICIEMHGGSTYREEIVVNATGSKTMIALMNVKWAESKECRYEFNIALRSLLTKGAPHIIPIITENFDWSPYPLITGVMANTNAIFYDKSNPSATWDNVIASLVALNLLPATPGAKKGSSIHVPATALEIPLPNDIAEWQCKHVAQWLQTLDFASPKDAFLSNWVDGPILLEITHEDLVDSIKLTNLQAKRLMREINLIKGYSVGSHELAPPASSLQSKQGFLTGGWVGWYEYADQKQKIRDPTSMDVTMVAGVVAGYGTDKVGDFLIQGTYDDKTLAIQWDKAYIGQHKIIYEGKLTKGNTIAGKWYSASSPDWGGRFELVKEK